MVPLRTNRRVFSDVSLAGISLSAAQQVIGASGFGSEAQSLRPFTGLQEGFVKLS
jgi:hypothetical protein